MPDTSSLKRLGPIFEYGVKLTCQHTRATRDEPNHSGVHADVSAVPSRQAGAHADRCLPMVLRVRAMPRCSEAEDG